jgi:hypothetical protein
MRVRGIIVLSLPSGVAQQGLRPGVRRCRHQPAARIDGNAIGAWPDYTPGMKNARLALSLLVLALLLAACGNKGELVHPDPAADGAQKS